MHGFYNRILTIDLTNKQIQIEQLSDETLCKTLGGKGLATHILLERNPVGVDPLAPENHLIFATGPFCGGRMWGGSRYGVYTKSPQTGFYAESYSGGKVPEAIDSTGYDAIIIVGKAEYPTSLTITPESVIFHDASSLWGAETFETEKKALANYSAPNEEYNKSGVVVIGPAGEKQVRFATISNDKWRCAGRTGVGAVMGSKFLKAIVFQGNRKREYADPKGVAEYSNNFSREGVANPGVKAYRKMGTTMMVSLMNTAGAFPAKYWNQGACDHWESISGETYHEEHEVIPHACAKCFMACGRLATLKKGRHKGLQLEGPEYETIYSFGGLCMVKDMDEVSYLNDLCDRLGIDTISAGNLCGLIMEAKDQKRIDYEIEYGNVDQLAKLLGDIASREGIGDILADGIIPASKHFGIEDLAIHVKGLEPAGYDPRKLKGMGLTFGTSPRGACHLRTTFYKPELAGWIPPDQIKEKAEMLIDYEDRLNIFDTLILCRFYRDLYSWDELEKAIHLTIGQSLKTDDLRAIASYILDMTRKFNLNEGLKPEDDRLPKRLHDEVLSDGSSLTSDEMEYLLEDYYQIRGWNKNGVPERFS